jgi:hypothetical protein
MTSAKFKQVAETQTRARSMGHREKDDVPKAVTELTAFIKKIRLTGCQ